MMTDVDEIIDYIKSLKKGFDKDLFQSKLDELAHVVESCGLEYDDFHTLFKVWLNLSIPITKWTSLGKCLVPRDRVEERTVDYAFRWLLANYDNHGNFSRMAFLLDWLTAAMDHNSIDMEALDSGYEIFFSMLSLEVLTAHTVKLIYNLTKPGDVTRTKVLELQTYAKKREGQKNMSKHIQVLLGLFKSYKPECVPENIPAVAIQTAFRKINGVLVIRFRRSQEKRNITHQEKEHLLWINPLSESARNKKANPLVPNMEFTNIGSKQYTEKEPQKNYLDFSDPARLLHYALQHPMSRPAKHRALLCNDTGLALLVLTPQSEQAFFSYELYHVLSTCFLEASPHTEAEKQHLLRRLSTAQNTLLQGLSVVTEFLANYLQLWDETEYFSEILDLVEWLSADRPTHVREIVEVLSRVYYRSQAMQQCAILTSLSRMYDNLVYSSTRSRHHFFCSSSGSHYRDLLPSVAAAINYLSNKALQISPDDMRALYWTGRCLESRYLLEIRWRVGGGLAPGNLSLALPLLNPSALLVDRVAAVLMAFRKIKSIMKSNKTQDEAHAEQQKTMEGYFVDVLNSLYRESVLKDRKSGFVFTKIHPQLVAKLGDVVPAADAMMSVRNHLAFVPYTRALDGEDPADGTVKMYFDTMVDGCFPNLKEFLMKSVPELR